MTGSIVLMVIGSVLLLPMAFILMMYIMRMLGDMLHDVFLDARDTFDMVLTLSLVVLTMIGAAFLWIGIATLPQ